MSKDQMTGSDLVKQEEYEAGLERAHLATMDRVDRRDKRGEIVSMTPTDKYRIGFDRIKWKR